MRKVTRRALRYPAGKEKAMNKLVINALGDRCPVPVVKAMKALDSMKEPGVLEVQVDEGAAVENLLRLASGRGLAAHSEDRGGGCYAVTMEVPSPGKIPANAPEIFCAPPAKGDFVVAVDSASMGRGDDELGNTLMKGFLYAISQLETLPFAVLFYNGGATLPVEGSPFVEDLRRMEAEGVTIMTCGTCLNYYGLTQKLAVGKVCNMYDIVETLGRAGKVIKP